jgi:hypothetical protein
LLPNNNYLICSGRDGYSFELTPDQQVVWEYITPLKAGRVVAQGDSLIANDNPTFRILRYPADYEAFEGRDLNPKFYLEENPDSAFCDLILPVTEVMPLTDLSIYPNPAHSELNISWSNTRSAELRLFDLTGRLLRQIPAAFSGHIIDVSGLTRGLYILQLGEIQYRKIVME